MSRRIKCTVVVAFALLLGPAMAQTNIDAGKPPAQIFADTCNACHRSPREIKPASAAFLRDHYSTGPREAASMAAYLASIGSDARAVQQRRPPTMGAGQGSPPGDKPPPSAAPSAAAIGAGLVPPAPIPSPAGANTAPATAPSPTPAPTVAAARSSQAVVAESAKPSASAARPRRPSESIEIGVQPAAAATETAPPPRAIVEELEE